MDPGTRHRDAGRVLLGGSPRRILRLSVAGASAVDRLRAGAPVGTTAGMLARRLTGAGAAHPIPPARAGELRDVTVLVPVRDRPEELGRCLQAVGEHPHVVVVDDGSRDPSRVREVAGSTGARIVRRPVPGGPAAARNTGLATVSTPFVAFLDSDCIPPPGWLRTLAAHMEDPALGAVAPRVRGRSARRTTAQRWAAARSPLDLGTHRGPVLPGGRIPYVPTAALLVRRSALGAGLDEGLRYGEDVDLVWRLCDAGWAVRYEPGVVVDHEEPATWRAFLARRYRYGTSAGPLAARHGDRLAPVLLAPYPTVIAAALLLRRPLAAAVVAAAQAHGVSRRLRGPGVPWWLGPQAVLRGTTQTLDGLARAGTMLTPGPLLLLAAVRPRARRGALGALVAAPLARWVGARAGGRTAGLDPVRWTVAGLADDAAYGAGVWAGALRSGSLRALLPAVRR
jgi:mycofactocin system glycosyltransferase